MCGYFVWDSKEWLHEDNYSESTLYIVNAKFFVIQKFLSTVSVLPKSCFVSQDGKGLNLLSPFTYSFLSFPSFSAFSFCLAFIIYCCSLFPFYCFLIVCVCLSSSPLFFYVIHCFHMSINHLLFLSFLMLFTVFLCLSFSLSLFT